VTNAFPTREWAQRHCEALGIPDPAGYFNCGVMLVDLERWRALETSRRIRAKVHEHRDLEPGPGFLGLDEAGFLRHMMSHPEQVLFPEQDAVNAVLWQDRVALHPRWNFTSQLSLLAPHAPGLDPAELAEAAASPAIRHFEGPGVSKPWHPECEATGRDVYWKHREQTPWA
jgi:lipopolysaccharide biosynthesis glycosyltransferase